MDIQEIIKNLQAKFGDKFDTAKVSNMLSGMDLGKFNMSQITSKLTQAGLLGDLDGDGIAESPIDEIKGKASQIFGGMFGGKKA